MEQYPMTLPSNGSAFWAVLEIQEADNGTRACIPLIFDDYDSAVARFGQIFAAAAQSSLPYHAVMIMDSLGRIQPQDRRIWDRRGIG